MEAGIVRKPLRRQACVGRLVKWGGGIEEAEEQVGLSTLCIERASSREALGFACLGLSESIFIF